jgi:hypothetical protein
MAYFLVIDESGQDHRDSPYEVLAGVAVEDKNLWKLIQAIQEAEISHFGIRYSGGGKELKAKRILKRKVFRMAEQLQPFDKEQRRALSKQCLEGGSSVGQPELTALAQAKLAYVHEVFKICRQFECKVFASIVADPTHAHGPMPTNYLRKDYSYLFERFFYFLEDIDPTTSGIIVFDELEKSRSHILLTQMDSYFKLTAKGKQRSGQIIPEPFFVHSDLTTGIQIADLMAYIISWGFRTKKMAGQRPARAELFGYVGRLRRLVYRTRRLVNENAFDVYGIAVIEVLKTKDVLEEPE